MSASILQREKESFLSRRTRNLHKHHIYFGNPGRKLSETWGCWCWLTADEHVGSMGVHTSRELDLYLKRICQKEFEERHGRAVFMEVFGRNYL